MTAVLISDGALYMTVGGSEGSVCRPGKVLRAALAGTDAGIVTPEVAAVSTCPASLSATATHVYWAEYRSGGAIRRFDKTTEQSSVVLEGRERPYAIRADESALYFVETDTGLWRVGLP